MPINNCARTGTWITGCLAGLALLTAQAEGAAGSGMAGQRIIARKTVDALPEPLKAYYAEHIDALLERAVEPDGFWRRQSRYRRRDQWHYVTLDAAAVDNSPAACVQAALAFPTEIEDARSLFRGAGIRRAGRLPWTLRDYVHQLVAALKARNDAEVISITGYLVHFCADAGDPFCVSRNRTGAQSMNLTFGVQSMGHELFAHQNVAYRSGWELVRRNADRYAASIDPEDFQYDLATPPTELVFETMIDALEDLAPICTADTDVLARMGITDGADLLSRQDEFYELLDAKCGEFRVAHLQRSARLAAALVHHAWRSADAPNLAQPARPSADYRPAPLLGSRDVGDAPPLSKPRPPAPIQFVASKNSKVFHHLDCPHAARIAERNRIEMVNEAAARQSGRHPCQSCGGTSSAAADEPVSANQPS